MAVGYAYHTDCLRHDPGRHPEHRDRLTGIMNLLSSSGLLTRLEELRVLPAAARDISRVHSPELVDQIRSLVEGKGGFLTADTVVSAGSWDAALAAVGGTLVTVRSVVEHVVDSAFAIVRPPGHHATRDLAMGFCLFNNVAIAADWALDEGGLERVAIVDIDVHHGNGTESIVREDPRIAYMSTHQYPFFPGTGHWRQAGPQAGAPTIVDVPLPASTGDIGHLRAYRDIIVPALDRFRPELIIVSAGYDSHFADPLAWMLLSVSGFRQIADLLVDAARRLCGGRIAFVLEGGYDIPALSHGVAATISAMLDEPYPDALGPAREAEADTEAYLDQVARWYLPRD